ncbi:MAG: biotin--[acetyl-CoA-carboxylase] ligase [Thermodesulfovibrionales bacterium]|nr:biotin--[acetyl-CoA-carboxylase] ligase [Thermodesulfovibrionales bacterium]
MQNKKGLLSERIIILDRVDSTNTYLSILAKEGYPHGTVVIADTQTAGRGRFRRQWFSPPGKNIYMSILVKPEGVNQSLSDFSILPLLAGIASARAIRYFTGLPVNLKWPNDLLLYEKKLGGILVESHMAPSVGILDAYFIVGIGINVNMKREELPEDIKDIATSLYMIAGREFERKPLIEEILKEFFILYEEFKSEGKTYIISEWQSLSSTLGRKVRCLMPDGREITGRAVALDDNGYLIVEKDGVLESIKAGDVFHCSS